MKRLGPILLLILSLSSPTAYVGCLDDAVAYHCVDGAFLYSIALHESHMSPLAISRNCDGSQGLGLMQINSTHLPWLARYNITWQQLLDACINTYVGAWTLHTSIDRFGTTWRAVDTYNATTPAKQPRYANQIYTWWRSLQRAALP